MTEIEIGTLAEKQMILWYLSFSDPNRFSGFLGAVVTEAPDLMGAIQKCHQLGINPGGEVMGFEVDLDDREARADIEAWDRDRIISREELKARGAVGVAR